MSTPLQNLDVLYKVRREAAEFIDVPALSFAIVEGQGDPEASRPPSRNLSRRPEA